MEVLKIMPQLDKCQKTFSGEEIITCAKIRERMQKVVKLIDDLL